MSKQHKWHKEIKAWADGAEIEANKHNEHNYWHTVLNPNWNECGVEFRIKPQPKEPQYLQVLKRISTGEYYLAEAYPFNSTDGTFKYIGKIKLEVKD